MFFPPEFQAYIETSIKNLDVDGLKTSLVGEAKEGTHDLDIKTCIERQIKNYWNAPFSEKQWLAALKIIHLLKNKDIPIDLSAITGNVLSELIHKLVVLKPSDAQWLLGNMRDKSTVAFRFTQEDYLLMPLYAYESRESAALYHCINEVKPDIGEDEFYFAFIGNYIQADSKQAYFLALIYPYTAARLDVLLDKALNYDSSCSLEAFIEYLKGNKQSLENFNNRLIPFLGRAFRNNAVKSMGVLLEKFSIAPSAIQAMVLKAVENSNIALLLTLCLNDFKKTAELIFQKYLPLEHEANQSMLFDKIITMLRFTSIETVDALIKAYQCDKDTQRILQRIYDEARQEFLLVAPAFSRVNSGVFQAFKAMYGRNVPDGLINRAKADIQYGKNRGFLVEELVAVMRTKPCIPIGSLHNLDDFPPASSSTLACSKKGSRVFAYLLEKIAEYNATTVSKEQSDTEPKYFKTLRTRGTFTPMQDQYAWGQILISAVFHYSQSKQIIKYPYLEKIEDIAGKVHCVYALKYRKNIINNVLFYPKEASIGCGHGRFPIQHTAGDIEDLLERMMQYPTLELTSNIGAEEKTSDHRLLTQFYEDAAQLVWLIGNTTPLIRGSGSVAELTLKTIFEYHRLQAPVLKPEFPQLDVLDIIFPLDDYTRLFSYFFEPISLLEPMRKPSLPHLSASEQIVAYYNEINQVEPLTQFIKRAKCSKTEGMDAPLSIAPFVPSNLSLNKR